MPRFEPADCAFSPPFISYVECGDLIVLEDRSRPEGQTIRLHVAVARSLGQEPEPDPLIYLPGGPGSFALHWLYGNITNYLDILKKRDIIFFDPRGVGYSEPSLDCPEVMEVFHETRAQPLSDQEWVDRQVAANRACRDRLVAAGVELSAYHSAAMAADVNDLRVALGYDKVNLFGVSYGTRTALTVLRDYPEVLRSLVLDSVIPLEVDLPGSDALSAQRALARIFQRCAEDPPCNAAFPDLAATLDRLTAAIDAAPLTIEVRHLLRDKDYQLFVNRSLLGWSLVESLYNFETAVYLPKLIYETQTGEDENFETLATSLEIYLLYGDYSSEGLRNSVLCSDEGTFTTFDEALERMAGVHPAIADFFKKDNEILFRTCEFWGANRADSWENLPVVSPLPVLVMSGEYDPVTPPIYGRQVAANLENAIFIEFPGLGHFVFADRRCPRDIVADFLDDPATPPDTQCAGLTQFNFITH